MSERSRTRLGRGLEALLGEYLGPAAEEEVVRVRVTEIAPNPFQPRREFPEAELAELEASIRESGLLQPLVVRPAGPSAPAGARYELVAGERRWRVVRRLGWTEVPALVRAVDDRALLILALVENLQRAQLSPLEEAEGYRRLMEEFGLSQQEVADAVKRDRSTVANTVRLLQLPAGVQRLLAEGRLSAGHARALLGLPNPHLQLELAERAAAEGWSVRMVEERVRTLRAGGPVPRAPAAAPAELAHVEAALRRALGTAVRIRIRGRKGRIEIPFADPDELARLLERLAGTDWETA